MFKNNKKLFIILGAIALLLLLLRLILSLTKPPQLTQASPSNQAKNIHLNSPLTLTFDKPIKEKNLSLQTNPPTHFTVSVKENTATATPKNSYIPQTTYQIKIYYQNQLQQTLTFQTQSAQSSPRQVQQIQERVERQYPLALQTPYETQNFHVTYSAPLTLEIELLTNQISGQQAIQLVKNWTKSNGVNPQTHTYTIKKTQDIEYETEIIR